MSPLKRDEDLENLLLDAGREDVLPRGAGRRAALALGVAGPLTLLTTRTVAAVKASATLKLVVVTSALSAIIAGGVVAERFSDQPGARSSDQPGAHASEQLETPPEPKSATTEAKPVAPSSNPALGPTAKPHETDLVVPAPSTGGRPKRAPSVDAVSVDALDREVVAVDAIRAALRSGDRAVALDSIARYRREFPRGALRPEVGLLETRAQALSP